MDRVPAPKTKTPPSAREKALRLLERSARSEAELRGALRRAGYERSEIEEALELCRRTGFVNDQLLTKDYVSMQLQRGSGPRLIRQKLVRRGIAGETAASALEAAAQDEPESARRALDFKLRMLVNEKDPRKKREKAYRFLVSRGFSMAIIHDVMDEAAACLTGKE